MYHGFQEDVEGGGAVGENRREKRGKKKKIKSSTGPNSKPRLTTTELFPSSI